MSREPQVGDTYKVIRKFATLGTNADGLEPYHLGDTLKLVGTTDVNPFGHEVDINWLVECKHYQPPQPEAVWAWIHRFIAIGCIELVNDE